MRPTLISAAAAAALSLSAVGATAHHSFAAVFDRDQPIEVTGTVTKVEWTNPHVWLYVDARNEDGTVDSWELEMGSPAGLIRRGWNRDSLQNGQVVTVAGFRARDGSLRGAVLTVTLSNGQSLFGAQNPQ